MLPHLVFVYGSLKRGQSNFWLMATAEFIARARTAEQAFRLLDLTAFPALIRTDEGPLSIVGELFAIDDNTLAAVDRLEDNGNLYQREPITVTETDDPMRQHEAWTYLYIRPLRRYRLWPSDEWSRP